MRINAPNSGTSFGSLLNGRTKMAVMLGIGVVLTLNGCQKEADEDWLPLNGTSQEAQSLLHICYHLDDEVYHVTIDGDTALSDLMRYGQIDKAKHSASV